MNLTEKFYKQFWKMTIAIHNSKQGFHPRWIDYCEKKGFPFKLVNCYDNDLINQLEGCDALMWHHSHQNPSDLIIAKHILYALEHTGFKVFPNFKTGWHFDDKIGQKYLLERLNAPFINTYVFYSQNEALVWADQTSFPKVWKLRGGAGSTNVKLIRTKGEAISIIKRSFKKGFPNYDGLGSLKERIRKFKGGQASIFEPIKGIIRLIKPPHFALTMGVERDYCYFQDFIPKNDSDIRIIVVENRAFALKRYVRPNDFRASGSGNFGHSRELFDERCIKIAFEVNEKIQSQSIAYDFVFDEQNNPLIIEISYGYTASGYDDCPGYWDEDLNWHEGKFNPQEWMVDNILKEIQGN